MIRMNWTCSMQTFTTVLLVRFSCIENNKLTWLRTTYNSHWREISYWTVKYGCCCVETQLVWARKSAFHTLFLLLFCHRRNSHLFRDFHRLYITPAHNIAVKCHTALLNSAYKAIFAAQNNCLNGSPVIASCTLHWVHAPTDKTARYRSI